MEIELLVTDVYSLHRPTFQKALVRHSRDVQLCVHGAGGRVARGPHRWKYTGRNERRTDERRGGRNAD